MAAGFFGSKEPQPPGIPLAPGRAVDRPAKSDPPCQKEGVLTFVQKGENFPFSCRAGKIQRMTYPQDHGTVRETGRITAPDFYGLLPARGKRGVLPGQMPAKTTRFPHFPSVKMTEALWQRIRFSAGFTV